MADDIILQPHDSTIGLSSKFSLPLATTSEDAKKSVTANEPNPSSSDAKEKPTDG